MELDRMSLPGGNSNSAVNKRGVNKWPVIKETVDQQ